MKLYMGQPSPRNSRRHNPNQLRCCYWHCNFLEIAMSNNGRMAVELPRSNGLWDTVEWKTFMAKHNLKYVHFDGCALNLQGKSGKFLRKPWTIATNDLSILQYFSQYVCPGNHEHESTQGPNASKSAYYTVEFAETLMRAWYPRQAYHHVPDVSNKAHAFVTKNLTRSAWSKDPKGRQAVEAEAIGLRRNKTWNDNLITTLDNLKHQSKVCQTPVKIASLHILCGIKHWEQPVEAHKYKERQRIVSTGDLIRNESDEIVLYADTATTPTALTALNLALFFGSCEHNLISPSDAIQAFLQAPIKEETRGLIPYD